MGTMLRGVILLILAGAIVFSSGCTCLFNPPHIDVPLVVRDSSGGALAIYEILKGDDARELYAQRISSGGSLQWGEKGVLIGCGYERESSTFDWHMVSDGAGGAIIAWEAFPTKPDWDLPYEEWKVHRVTTILRLDSQGNILWRREVKPFYIMISDGSGGAIISYVDYSSEAKTLNALRIDSRGDYPWGEDGVSLFWGNYSSSLRMVGDGSGGTIIVQQDDRYLSDTRFQCFAQKVDSMGRLIWGEKGIPVYIPLESFEPVELINDGSGGAILARIMQIGGSFDIYVQRVDSSGKTLWQQDGKPLGLSKEEFRLQVQMIADGQGGVVLIWDEGPSIYAQKIDTAGNAGWQSGGVQVYHQEIEEFLQSFYRDVASDDDGGAIVVWWYQGKTEARHGALRAQRLSANGKALWQANGVLVSTGVKGHYTPATISQDSFGGALVAWGIGRNRNHAEKSYVQKIDSGGNLLWGAKGIRLNP